MGVGRSASVMLNHDVEELNPVCDRRHNKET
jgi:hypothetical protein